MRINKAALVAAVALALTLGLAGCAPATNGGGTPTTPEPSVPVINPTDYVAGDSIAVELVNQIGTDTTRRAYLLPSGEWMIVEIDKPLPTEVHAAEIESLEKLTRGNGLVVPRTINDSLTGKKTLVVYGKWADTTNSGSAYFYGVLEDNSYVSPNQVSKDKQAMIDWAKNRLAGKPDPEMWELIIIEQPRT